MKSLCVLIVEDEIIIAETIALYVKERGHEVLDIAISFEEAVKAYHLKKPDVVLLDIRLYGEKSGIDFGKYLLSLKDHPPFIYLTSQYDRRVVNIALTTNPNGYLTKPINKESLWTTIETAASTISEEPKIKNLYDGKINHKINPKDILYAQADHVYVNIYSKDGNTITVRNSLKQIVQSLENQSLVICHRSYVVNLDHIAKWTGTMLILDDGSQIPLSRTKREEILSRLVSS